MRIHADPEPTYALCSMAHGVEGEEVVLANLELVSAPRIITQMVREGGGGGVIK
jgi:hypothetical protein